MQRLLFALVLVSTHTIAQQKMVVTTTSQLTNANVYYGYGAELTHKAKANVVAGQQEIVINNISTTIDQNTLQIAAPENVVLLSYRYNLKTETVAAAPNPLYKKMEDSIKVIQKQVGSNVQEWQLNEEQLNKTSKIIDSYSANPNKTITTAEVLKLIDYYNGKIQLYRTIMYALKLKRDELEIQKKEIADRLVELQNKDENQVQKPIGQIILEVLTKENTAADFSIIYYTRNAGWVPTYDMRVKSIDNSFKLMYKAMVSQTTGLDWKQVKLTLSTSNPNQGTTIPVLNPLVLQLYVPTVYNNMLQGRSAGIVYNRAQSMNTQSLKVTGEKIEIDSEEKQEDASDISSYTTLNESQLFTSFEIDLPYNIPTDGNSYSVAIKEEKINATYKHYSIPKLDKDAFLLAEINNWEELNLLPGEANIIMDNVYLGKSFIDPNTTMDTLNISMGRDKRLSTKRLLMKENSKTKFIGNNKVETFTYEITLKNNKKEAVNVLLKDQFPLSRMADVQVKLEDDGGAEVNEELATLNWKVNIKPGEQKKYRFSYKVTYPKDKKLINLR